MKKRAMGGKPPDEWPETIDDAARAILRDYENYEDDGRKASVASLAALIAYVALKDAGVAERQARRILDVANELVGSLDRPKRD